MNSEKSRWSRSESPSGSAIASRSVQAALSCVIQLVLEIGALLGGQARHATDNVEPPLQVYHLPPSGRLVQPIHILGEQHLALTVRLQSGQRVMRPVRSGLSKPPPTNHAARQ